MDTKQIIEKYFPNKDKITMHGNMVMYEFPAEEIVILCQSLYNECELPLKIITAFDDRKNDGFFKICYVFGIKQENIFLVPCIKTKNKFPSLTPYIHEASNYERKIQTFFGLTPIGHPDARSIILHENWPDHLYPLRKDFPWNERPEKAETPFTFRGVYGEGIYEIPVGPVHAGIIEPGHFRFNVVGEEILMLEPRLGYSHKGSEKLFEVLPLEEKIRLSERISGDSSFSHSLSFCQALETLGNIQISDQASYSRVIFGELERLANHFSDIGAIMTDTGFNFGGANGARLREIIMQINERLTGSRFLRGVNVIGGVKKTMNLDDRSLIQDNVTALQNDFSEVIKIAENSGSLLSRLKDTGKLDKQIAKDHGVLGVAGRATGFLSDARVDYSYAAYHELPIYIASETSGDVYARFYVRIQEVYNSFEILKKAILNFPKKNVSLPNNITFKKNAYAIGIVEGWRGDIVYLVATDYDGNISRVDVRDPSFLNWTVVGHAGKGNMVPDFPLINKSFNLSYSGNDL